jgi:F0F1-type ATP synthase membrane subunit b/b'
MACEPNETLINGRCVKKTFLNSPGGIGAIGAALTGVGAAIKKKIANKKEAKADAAKTLKDMKSVSSKARMKVGGMVNSNKKITVTKTATKLKGGISKAPKKAVPKTKKGKC